MSELTLEDIHKIVGQLTLENIVLRSRIAELTPSQEETVTVAEDNK